MSLNSNSLSYVFADSLRALKENFSTMSVSALTVGFSLSILSFFIIIVFNVNTLVNLWGDSAKTVLYVEDGAIASGAEKTILSDLKKVSGVKDAKYISKDEALEILKTTMEGSEGILDGIKGNPLPASFEITLESKIIKEGKIEEVVKHFEGLKFVESVQYGKVWIEKLGAILGFIRVFTLVVSVFIASAIIFIISNTIRLAVYSKSSEIEVLRLNGASDSYIKIPFFIDALFQGLFGSIIAFIFLSLGMSIISYNIDPYVSGVVTLPFGYLPLVLILIATGVFLSVAASYLSLGKFLSNLKDI